MRRQRQDNVILNPGKPIRPSKGCFPFSLSRGKQERDSLTVGPYQVGIIIWDGTVLDVFSGDTRPLPQGDVQTYIASTAPFNLTFWLKVPWESPDPNDLVMNPPLVTSDGEHVTGRIDLTLSVTTKDLDGTLVTPGDPSEGAHRLLQFLGLYGEIITSSDIADTVKGELLPKLLALDLNEYKADELRSNRSVLRDFTKSLETELSLTTERFGLQLIQFHLNWDIRDRKPQSHTELHPFGVKSNEKGDGGSTPLHQATWDGDSSSTPLHQTAWEEDCSSTPLHQAAWEGQTEKALALISTGADIHARDDVGHTPLHMAVKNGHTKTALALVSAGADIHAMSEYHCSTPLHAAAAEGCTETVLALVSAGADIHRGVNGLTPLHVAAAEGHTETALALVSAGADIHALIVYGDTPLHRAAENGHTETALALVSAGADIHARTDSGEPPLHMAVTNGHTNTALALLSAGADINGSDTVPLMQPLHVAAFEGHTETALALVSVGADIHARSETGYTSLHGAAQGGHTETALALVSVGADIHARANDGLTPTHVALVWGHFETAQVLTG